MTTIVGAHAGSRKTLTRYLSLAAIATALIVTWSAGFVGVRFASDHASISVVLLWRSLVSGLFLLPFCLFFGPRPSRTDVLFQIVFGALAMSGYLGGFATAIALGVPTGLVALITDMLPLAVALLSWPILGKALTTRQWIGSFVGFGGILIVSSPAFSLSGATAPFWCYLLPVAGTVALALATLLQKRFSIGTIPVYQSLCIQCLSASFIFAIAAWYNGQVSPPLETKFIGGILWLVFVATFGSWSLYYLALRRFSATKVTSIIYLSPPVTMLWAWAMFNEPLTWSMALGLTVSLAGVLMVLRYEGAETREA